MERLNWGCPDCSNKTILGERYLGEADGGGGNTIQGLLSSHLRFLEGYVDVGDR